MRNMDLPGEYYCKYCGKFCKSINSLRQHEIRCSKNVDRIKGGVEYLNDDITSGKRKRWNTGLTAEDNESVKKQRNRLKERYSAGEIINPIKNTHHSEEQKMKQRLSTLAYIEKCKGPIRQRYSIVACNYINKLNENNNWNLQHAENGGEVEVCGYFLDGYDKELNIVFEYDEPYHYVDVENNILRQKDIDRQNYIISTIGCKFYRYNEKLKLFYEVK